jgi:hypothetical protein
MRALLPLLVLAGCARSAPAAVEIPGRAVEVRPVVLPDGHPPVGTEAPAPPFGRGGRAPRRLDVDQLRGALLAATGFIWVAPRRVPDPDSRVGTSVHLEADMLEVLAATLGRPDYVTSTNESIDPAVTFSKLAGDAARSACRASIKADLANAKNDPPRRILRETDVRKNLAYLALRFWGRTVAPGDAALDPLERLFERASAPPADAKGTAHGAAAPSEGWRAVCIAMATDPQFLTY